jgi:hypothetical protein
MKRNLSLILCLMLILLVWPCDLSAQDDPFGSGKKSEGKGKKKDDEEPLVLQRQREHPVILSLRESPPKTIGEVTRALKLTLEIDRPIEFRQYAEQWLALKPNTKAMVEQHTRYGAAFFWELTRREPFAQLGREIGNQVLNAAAADAHDEAKLAAAVKQLFDEKTKVTGMTALALAGEAGAVAVLQHAINEPNAQHHVMLQRALLTLRGEAVGPCLAALYSGNEATQADAALVLGQLNAARAIPHLVGMSVRHDQTASTVAAQQAVSLMTELPPTADEVIYFLQKRITHLLQGELPGDLNVDAQIPLWLWNVEKKLPEMRTFRPTVASTMVASQLAQYLSKLDMKHYATQVQLAIRVQLEALKQQQGLDRPLTESQQKQYTHFTVGIIETILSESLQQGQYGAAVACCELLGARAETITLQRGVTETPLIQALACPDQRTQFAAVQAILSCANESPYAGSSRVQETICFLLSGVGRRKVLIGHPRAAEATRIAALYSSLGFEVESATRGSDLCRLAQQSADVELILLSDALDRPGVHETLQMLRQDIRSASIPVGIMVVDPDFERGAKLAQRSDRQTEILYPPNNEAAVRFNNRLILEHASPYAVSAEVRAEHALAVAKSISNLFTAKHPPNYYEYGRWVPALEKASSVSHLSHVCFEALANIGNPRSQSFLLEQALLPARPLAERRAAAKQFATAVSSYGMHISQKQRLQTVQLYREATDAGENRELLRELLKVLELSPESPATLENVP